MENIHNEDVVNLSRDSSSGDLRCNLNLAYK